MTDEEVPFWQDRLASTAAAFGQDLLDRGFELREDGSYLGPIPIPGPGTGMVPKRFVVRLPDTFPFSWPQVFTPTPPSVLTWHMNAGGELCLFRPSDNPARPWSTVDGLFDRVAYWHDRNAKGWPGDPGDPDLARYFKHQTLHLVSYDSTEHPVGPLVSLDIHGSDWRHLTTSVENRRFRRRDTSLWWYGVDVGLVETPIYNWSTLVRALPEDDAEEVKDHALKDMGVLLVHYQRATPDGTRHAAIALFVKAPEASAPQHHGRVTTAVVDPNAQPTLATFDLVDDSPIARWYRAGTDASRLVDKHVAIVGCGAIGSFTADMLARSGVGTLTLVDPDRLAPGNCVRHLADRRYVPKDKVDAIKKVLVDAELLTAEKIITIPERLTAVTAATLLANADLVIDATANASASGLLIDLVNHLGRVNFIKVALHREGQIIRVDRFGDGTRPDASRPAFIQSLGQVPTYRDAGCGDPISTTPPSAVVAAAATTVRFAVDYLRPRNQRRLPDSQVEVLVPQPDEPWTVVGVTHDRSAEPDTGALLGVTKSRWRSWRSRTSPK